MYPLVKGYIEIYSIIKATLKSIGATDIVVAENGYQASKLLATNNIDLIISDWDMPKITGLQFLGFVRGNEAYKHIPFILLTASKDKSRVKSAIELGVNDYLSKPFTPQALEQKVSRIIKKYNLPKRDTIELE